MTSPLKTERLAAGAAGLTRAVAILQAGGLVSFGTETVYGLGADATNPRAVARIFEAKGRPHFNPLICHYGDAGMAKRDVQMNEMAQRLAERFWPGALSLVLPRLITSKIATLAGAGLETLAIRVPAHAGARTLIEALGRPIAAPSANRSGRISPTSAAHVLADLDGRIEAIIDHGPCPVGIESTVLDLTGDRPFLLRPGGVTIEELEAVIGPVARGIDPARAEAARRLRSPGLLVSHYAPALPVRLNATFIDADEALLAFGPPLPGADIVFNLSPASDLPEAASRLFDGLHELDRRAVLQGRRQIAVMPIPTSGLGLAITDRLTRAAAPRPMAPHQLD